MELDITIPDHVKDPKELSKLLKLSVDYFKKEVSDHVTKELIRFASEMASIKESIEIQ